MTVTCDSRGYRVDTDCPDCASLILRTKAQAKVIERLSAESQLAQRIARGYEQDLQAAHDEIDKLRTIVDSAVASRT